jgi:hypothetical protein
VPDGFEFCPSTMVGDVNNNIIPAANAVLHRRRSCPDIGRLSISIAIKVLPFPDATMASIVVQELIWINLERKCGASRT